MDDGNEDGCRENGMAMRLDKYLVELGAGTRSEVKKRIRDRQVTVNGTTAQKPEMKIDEETDEVCLSGRRLIYAAYEYYLFYKPAGCVSATQDALHRTVMDYLSDTVRSDLFPVGRLDIDTEGLLLVTNDGALAHDLLSPARHVPKTYYAKVEGRVTAEDIRLFAEGVDIGEDVPTKPAGLAIKESGDISEVELTITEGKYHQVKRMFHAVGKEVVYLKRISMGALRLPDDMQPGEYRPLTVQELACLRQQPRKEAGSME